VCVRACVRACVRVCVCVDELDQPLCYLCRFKFKQEECSIFALEATIDGHTVVGEIKRTEEALDAYVLQHLQSRLSFFLNIFPFISLDMMTH